MNCIEPDANSTVTGLIWNLPAMARISIGILQIFLNSAMLVAIVIYKELRTSFAVYLAFLFFLNVIYAASAYPLEIIRQGYWGRYWLPSSVCTVHMYLFWVMSAVPVHIHVLITLNRIWAMTFPVSYKNVHGEKVALLLCCIMTVYVHALCLPVVILDAMYYRLPEKENGCFLNTESQMVATTIISIISCDVPIVVVVGAYPFLYYKQARRGKKLTASASRTGASTNVTNKVGQSPRSTRSSSLSHPFLVLTLLTVSVLILWTPNQVTWTIGCVTAVGDMPGLWHTFSIFYLLQAVFDPILFAFSLNRFRNLLANLICCK
ncbi:uncharacterized protein LOC129595509 [Paramacrobiotus metropolitanus]|uniref:uncharacterized protein LOC129595509 n=1 Tax=Paramacrobiotus metropolitanus TaxID=2943436 RepID=UPI0024459816|nr:uncharacterized protein LOC129595509 [Paramacrobiotus metropolitanus]XP_055348525.1 uncharacterized protein LOC129595509 [Paramacrobiotus metropolitanus]